ncbi:unnamed protein product [Litomosoides sigmodontis]|uniref:Clc-like protein n=1 Tax=Litomosoides sigmodontis TaxID=42156 RepID=A0A3P6URC6_LITSI|nr:unnamed protein product [Litomosoides sigmodontis]
MSILTSTIALLTPQWQTVTITEFHTEHQHGLWMDCILGKKHVQGASERSLHCTYKFENAEKSDLENDEDNEEQHKFHNVFRLAQSCSMFVTSGVIVSSNFMLLPDVCTVFSYCSSCFVHVIIDFKASMFRCIRRDSPITFPRGSLLSNCTAFGDFTFTSAFIIAIFSIVGVVVFFINSHKVEIRFVQSITRTYEQRCGYSFYLALSACLTFLAAFLCSVLCAVMVFLHARNRRQPPKTYPLINSAV